MMNQESDISNCQLLLDTLKPELLTLRSIINELSMIDSPYKAQLNYLKVIANSANQTTDQTGKVSYILEELDLFAHLMRTIIDDEQQRESYLNTGFISKCDSLQKNIGAKMANMFAKH